MIQITNTLTGKKETFEPLEKGKVRLYHCGPTVYGYTHIGNARPAVFFDVVARYLEYRGYEVTHVSNYTDVEDKIIKRARDEGTTWQEIVETYIKAYDEDMERLGVRRPKVAPRVTEHISEIITHIEGLVKNGTAYVAEDGEVFYSVRAFKEYGKLSKKNIDDLLVGARVDPNEKKRDPIDFSLWKPQKQDDEAAWDSPWGKGRPGWHIECSVMAMKYLGETFDIHGGGVDLIHPHHENEIAQSEALTNKPFVKYWMHSNMLTMASEKMSKSLGNIFLNRDFTLKYSAETLRYLLLSGHYRSPIDFSDQHVREVQSCLHRFYRTKQRCEELSTIEGTAGATEEEKRVEETAATILERFEAAMDDDFNTAKVVGYVFDYLRAMNAYIERKKFKPSAKTGFIASQFLENVATISKVINLFGEESTGYLNLLRNQVIEEKGLTAADIAAKIKERAQARADKDWAKSDQIRDELLKQGIELQDRGDETGWDVVF